MPSSEQTTITLRMWKHIKRHSHSIVIQVIAFSLITGFAVYEIRQARNHVQDKFDRSYQELEDFTSRQARRIDYLAEKVKRLGQMALTPIDLASDSYEKARNYYSELKEEVESTDWQSPSKYYQDLKKKVENSPWMATDNDNPADAATEINNKKLKEERMNK